MPSKSTSVNIRCPKCQSILTGTCWEKVDGDANPELRANLLNGTLFQVKCTTCDHTFDVHTVFRYTEDSEGLYIYLIPNPLLAQLTQEELYQRQAAFQLLRRTYDHFFEVNDLHDMLDLIRKHSSKPVPVSFERKIPMPQPTTVNKSVSDEFLLQHRLDPKNKVTQFAIGLCFLHGRSIADKGVVTISFQKDMEAAIDWLKKAADQNYADAQCTLGYIYALKGAADNTYYIEAANHFKKATANKSRLESELMLANLIGKIKCEACDSLSLVLFEQLKDIEKREITDIAEHLKRNAFINKSYR